MNPWQWLASVREGRAVGADEAFEQLPGVDRRPRVYIAAPFPMRPAALVARQAFETAGAVVTANWIAGSGTAPDSDPAARECLADVEACDWLVALNPSGWEDRGTGGRHVEFGYALALEKRLVVVGGCSNVFHHLSSVAQVRSVAEAVALVCPWRRA